MVVLRVGLNATDPVVSRAARRGGIPKEEILENPANDLWKLHLVHSAKLVAFALASHRNIKTGACYPSVTLLSDECTLSRKAVFIALADLKKFGFLTWQKRPRPKSNLYYFFIPGQLIDRVRLFECCTDEDGVVTPSTLRGDEVFRKVVTPSSHDSAPQYTEKVTSSTPKQPKLITKEHPYDELKKIRSRLSSIRNVEQKERCKLISECISVCREMAVAGSVNTYDPRFSSVWTQLNVLKDKYPPVAVDQT